MNAIISNGDYTASVQLPVERKQLAGALSYLGKNHASAYDIKYNEKSDQGLSFTLDDAQPPLRLEEGSLPKESMAMLEQIRTIDKDRLIKYVGRIDAGSANAIERASLASLGIDIYKTFKRLYS